MKSKIFLFLFVFLLPYSSAVLINNPKLPLTEQATTTSSSGGSFLSLDFTGTTGFDDGVDNTGGTPYWNDVIDKPALCYANGTGCSDLSSYATTSYVDTQNTSQNNYVLYVNNTCSAYTDAKLGLYYLASNPSNYITSASLSPYLLIANWNSTNVSYALVSQTYNKTDVDANISLANTSQTNYNNQQNTSQNNARVVDNTSNNNAMLNYNNTMKSYVDSQDSLFNTSQTNHINTKLDLTGGTLTGNLVVNTNITTGTILKINVLVVGPLPTNGTAGFCGSPYNGSIARNSTGVWGCTNAARWKLIY